MILGSRLPRSRANRPPRVFSGLPRRRIPHFLPQNTKIQQMEFLGFRYYLFRRLLGLKTGSPGFSDGGASSWPAQTTAARPHGGGTSSRSSGDGLRSRERRERGRHSLSFSRPSPLNIGHFGREMTKMPSSHLPWTGCPQGQNGLLAGFISSNFFF